MRGRSTREIVLLMFAATVCAAVLLAGAGLVLVAIIHPQVDLTSETKALARTIEVVLGVVAGFVVGKINNKNGGTSDDE